MFYKRLAFVALVILSSQQVNAENAGSMSAYNKELKQLRAFHAGMLSITYLILIILL